MRLQGKVALITGAGTGIGAATAHRFVTEGARVVLTGRRPGPLEQLATDLEKLSTNTHSALAGDSDAAGSPAGTGPHGPADAARPAGQPGPVSPATSATSATAAGLATSGTSGTSAGAVGPVGPVGPVRSVGPAGSAGSAGLAGSAGPAGLVGSTGSVGVVGVGSGVVAVAVAGDMAEGDQARAAVEVCLERFGRLDVVVANAGGHGGEAVADTSDESWQEALHANLNTCFVTCREALPALQSSRGAIVIVSSIAGLAAGPAVSGYVTTKHALIGLTRSIARDYGPAVRANCLCPGWVVTPMADDQMDFLTARDGITREQAYDLVTKDVPLRRPATADEIAAICLFLASDESAIMTGSVVVADGGATAVDLPTLPFA